MNDDRGPGPTADPNAGEPAPDLVRLCALVDGELPEAEGAALRAALAHDARAAELAEHYGQQNAALKALFPLPADLRYVLVRASMPWWRRALAATGWVVAGLALALGVAWLPGASADPNAFARRADAAYVVFAPEERHPVEVAAADQAHLRAWLSRRLARTLTIPSLDEYGFTLLGGRLLVGEAGPAAQLMYQDPAGERLTLYITPAAPALATLGVLRQADRRTFYWVSGGAGYALSGQLPEARLRTIASDVCASLGGDPQAWQKHGNTQ